MYQADCEYLVPSMAPRPVPEHAPRVRIGGPVTGIRVTDPADPADHDNSVRCTFVGLAHSDHNVVEFLHRAGPAFGEDALDDPMWVEWKGGRAHEYEPVLPWKSARRPRRCTHCDAASEPRTEVCTGSMWSAGRAARTALPPPSTESQPCPPRNPGKGFQGGLWSWLIVRHEGHGSAAPQHQDDSDDDNDDDDGTQTYIHELLFPSGSSTHRCCKEPSSPVKAFQPAPVILFPRCDMHPQLLSAAEVLSCTFLRLLLMFDPPGYP